MNPNFCYVCRKDKLYCRHSLYGGKQRRGVEKV